MATDTTASHNTTAPTDDLAEAEPHTLRYRLLHTAGSIVRGQRRGCL
ncbi:MAG: hypothetical protein ACRDRW_01530 [Pseudonocardiaceae bacterium]